MSERPRLMLLSARSQDALRTQAGACATAVLAGSVRTTRPSPPHPCDEGGGQTACRLAVLGSSERELSRGLTAFARGAVRRGVIWGHVLPAQERAVAFAFTGHGGQHWRMGAELFDSERVFRDALERMESLLEMLADWSLLEHLYGDERTSRLSGPEMRISQAALFGLQTALAELWRSYGVEPGAVLGHSVGEIAAAREARALDLTSAIHLVCVRGELMQRVADELPGCGAMAAVELGPRQIVRYLGGRHGALSVAAHNSPGWVTVSGDAEEIDALAGVLEEREIVCRRLRVPVAAHSPHVDGIRAELEKRVTAISAAPPRIPLYSTVVGRRLERAPDDRYWGRNLRGPVLFAEAIAAALADGFRTIIELGPHPALLPSIRENIAAVGVAGTSLPSLEREASDRRMVLTTLAELYVRGHPVRWSAVHCAAVRHVCPPVPPR